jgi:beta-phosphoglucomutase-like phosphatase (HAD superfamily)
MSPGAATQTTSAARIAAGLPGAGRCDDEPGMETAEAVHQLPAEPAPPAEPHGETPIDLDELAAHWRLALDAAEDALHSASRMAHRLGFPPDELAERTRGITLQRQEIGRLLDETARLEHVHLRRRMSTPRPTRRMLGLPHAVLACVFDLDGVLTGSAAVHAAAWAETFDELLSRRVERTGERFAPFRPFDLRTDYERHIHGRPRLDGVHAFLASRGIRLPEGGPDDPPGAETVHGLANRKREALVRRLDHEGVTAFEGSRTYLEAARDAGLRCAVVSPSTHTDDFLARAGIESLVPLRVDGRSIRAEHLRSKPAPDTLLAACRLLAVDPSQTAAFETTAAGVEACRAAGMRFVVGVDRADGTGDPDTDARDADVVVADLAALLDPQLAA